MDAAQGRRTARAFVPAGLIAGGLVLLLPWPPAAIFAVAGGFVEWPRAPTVQAVAAGVFGLALVAYPVVYIACAIAALLWIRRRPARALGAALLPWVDIGACVAAFALGAMSS
jgi:hypothetical protein